MLFSVEPIGFSGDFNGNIIKQNGIELRFMGYTLLQTNSLLWNMDDSKIICQQNRYPLVI